MGPCQEGVGGSAEAQARVHCQPGLSLGSWGCSAASLSCAPQEQWQPPPLQNCGRLDPATATPAYFSTGELGVGVTPRGRRRGPFPAMQPEGCKAKCFLWPPAGVMSTTERLGCFLHGLFLPWCAAGALCGGGEPHQPCARRTPPLLLFHVQDK